MFPIFSYFCLLHRGNIGEYGTDYRRLYKTILFFPFQKEMMALLLLKKEQRDAFYCKRKPALKETFGPYRFLEVVPYTYVEVVSCMLAHLQTYGFCMEAKNSLSEVGDSSVFQEKTLTGEFF